MPKTKQKRRPGAGRPPIDRQGSVIAQVRFTQDDWKRIEAVASKYASNGKSNASKVIRAAVRHWLRLHQKPEQHVHLLAALITLLITRIELKTNKQWLNDLVTARAVREQIAQLIEHFGPPFNTNEQPDVPADVASTASQLIAVLEGLRPILGAPAVGAGVFADQEILSWMIRDLDAVSAGFTRNQAWIRSRTKKGNKS